ncbi:hypothetical protein ABEB36_000698 [Hypothenemus hampei]|uniref:SprT-like domain-containing protein n=1 Tax=Hypothenemus hampei TaxID=57062 RepID=A0ABD1FCQ5_HYPHA
MAEIDYQMALLLQHKFNEESKNQYAVDMDRKLALELQDQYNTEIELERPSNNLVYKKRTNIDSSKSLVDPSWEVIDPTPDVYVLFTAFSQRFFWNALGSVTVSWSKRMTTCAGICSYNPAGGLCSITLSEPLLKLRPRKDLVETLLHEMIHAYLFVTRNNRDRDGHGPEFCSHMYRINKEAGTNITIYHDFHDEVALYKQHVWKCDGPCQHRPPYFGIVKRATNRNPGPNDFWWTQHQNNCGGVFVKIKSPAATEEKSNKTRGKSQSSTKENNQSSDIRKYFPVSNQSSVLAQQNSQSSNIHVMPTTSKQNAEIAQVIPSQTSNIFGFTNLNDQSKGTRKKNSGSNTFVITKTTGKSSTINSAGVPTTFSGTGRSLSSSSLHNDNYSIVREHWLKKFDNIGKSQKRSNSSVCLNSNKPAKLPCLEKVKCPVCDMEFYSKDVYDHLDVCPGISSH